MTRVLFVCTGNICRSPLAEVLLRHEASKRGLGHVTAESAGTGAWDGVPASEGAYLVALEHDLDLSGHRAQLVTPALVERADLILTMARHHAGRVEELGGRGRTWLLGTYAGRPDAEAEVSDPFGSDIEVYRATFEELAELVALAADRIEGEADAADQRP